MNFPLPLPSEDSDAGYFARQLAELLGPAYQALPGSLVAADLLALGGAIAAGRSTNVAAVGESFADSAVSLLSELETAYGLAIRTDLSTAIRQTRLAAKVRAARAATPQSILSAIRKIDPTATIVENTPVDVQFTGNPATVFYWAVVVAQAVYADPNLRPQLLQIVSQMQPAHTHGNVACTVGFLCDDPNSLTDRDVLGV